ncbi:hypothetical protein RCL1_004718 [Eukaryota sp. TZLM3-RCL]
MLTDQDIESISEQPPMFCYQCEQAGREKGCYTNRGVCSKDATQSALFDCLLAGAFSLAIHARPLIDQANFQLPKDWSEALIDAFFLTLTNVNFSHDDVIPYVRRLATCKQAAIAERTKRNIPELSYTAEFGNEGSFLLRDWLPAGDTPSEIAEQGRQFGIYKSLKKQGATITGLQQVSIYGLKGLSAYSHHINMLGGDINPDGLGIIETLSDIIQGQRDLLDIAKNVGKLNFDTMKRLDEANTNAYGVPTPTRINYGVRAGKCILMTGHDLRDLFSLLKATEGTGINVYTHGEMQPANAYPKLREFPHFVGNFGSAWQNQRKEFALFPGPIVANTNCIMPPTENYAYRAFSCNVVGHDKFIHIPYIKPGEPEKDWSPVIKLAMECPGFEADGPAPFENFLESQVGTTNWRFTTPLIPDVLQLVKEQKLRRIIFIGGCDGSYPGRNYYNDLAELVQKNHPDCIVAGSACGVYRYITTKDFGNLPGTELPRMFYMGQCNDTFSAIVLVAEIAKAAGIGLNEVPVSYFVSWFEQKAVAIFLTLMYLGIKNIRLGPRSPAWISPNAFKVLHDDLNLMMIDDPQNDLEAALNGQ